ncbi:hypothetical protein BKA62DRAFT_796670, partial [Auriculariales sp. MPI-PUGE-AT-0066]
TDLVSKFNFLPRRAQAPSGLVSNEWHFDIRYIPLDPPLHLLFIVQAESGYIHTERLPVGHESARSGVSFFPETAEDAAPEILHAILHAYVNGMGRMEDNPPPGPWKLTTGERSLAIAIGNAMKAAGVSAVELHTIRTSSSHVTKIADERFANLFKTISGPPQANMPAPDMIFYSKHKPGIISKASPNGFEFAIAYYQLQSNATPPDANIDKRPAFDFSKIQTQDLAKSRVQLVAVTEMTDASHELRSTAHAILTQWYMNRGGDHIPTRYVFSAAWHAEQALRHAEHVSPSGFRASPSVLLFLTSVFAKNHQLYPPLLMLRRCDAALKTRQDQMVAQDSAAMVKRLKHPNRYRCANVGCGIMTSSGQALQRCGGKCDEDKRPYYCSKECQRADWKVHKPFCKPGMPCSVIADDHDGPGFVTAGAGGGTSISTRIPGQDGRTHLVSSSTMSPEYLRDFRAAVERLDVSSDS